MLLSILPLLSAGAMQSLQGVLVPQLLAYGPLAAGVHYLATKRVDGISFPPLDSMSQETAAAAAAGAEKVLQQICQQHPGFVHGDLRLANFLLLHSSDDTAAPGVMLIDFAASRLDGSAVEVQAQFKQLRLLLRR